ncbi:MAG: hypothetical protein E7Z88_02125 [Cyanobacteria bacterium SIG27]|nr:hypothetical protein [Cyanobacteria bacterium SIG27]
MENKKNIIILTIFFVIISIFFYGKTGNMLIDFSRESYIPFQINNNEHLIKNILLIYGPLGYILNSFLYKISTNINLILIEAHVISYGILILFYLIANKFLSNKASLILSVFFVLISIFSFSTFSFVLPYSYSTLVAILGIYLAIFSLLYDKKTTLFLSLGLILSARIEFFIPVFIISLLHLIHSKKNFKKEICYILIFPSICLLYFLINSINLEDIIKNSYYLSNMLNANSLKHLYKGMGSFFEINYFKFNLIISIKLLLISSISYFFALTKKENIAYFVFIIGLLFIDATNAFNLLGIFTIILTIIYFKKGKIEKNELILILTSLAICLKSIFATNSLNYANFGYFLLILSCFLLLQKNLNKKWLMNTLIIFLIFSTVKNVTYYVELPKEKIKTKIGNLYINKNESEIFKKTNYYIEKNIKPNESFVVLPEGQLFNLIHKKSYNYPNYTFTPLDFETFKEEEIIQNLKNNKTDYIIFYPRNTLDYGAQTICYDYAVDFCYYIIDNYTKVATIDNNMKVLIFKLNEK